jgi:hypothetical protein
MFSSYASKFAAAQPSAILITIVPLDCRGRYRAYLGLRPLVAGTRTPLLDVARELIRLGADPDTVLVMRHAGAGHDALRGRLGTAAGLTVEECSDGRPRFRPYRPRLSEGSPPMRASPSPCAANHNDLTEAAS